MNSSGEPWTEHRDELLERVVRKGRARKRARSLAVGAVVVALIAALGAGVYLPNRGTRSLRVANVVPSTTTTSVPAQTARPAGVLLIGDAVMLGATIALENAIPGAKVDAAISRQLKHAIPILAADKRSGDLPKTVVIHLGDNGPSGADATQQTQILVGQIMTIVGPQTTVYFLSLKLPRPWESTVNAGLYAAAAAHSTKLHVLPWGEVGPSHPDWFTVDGFHLTPAGQTAYAEFIRGGVLGLPTTEAPGSPISVDLDGDGRADQLHVVAEAGVLGPPAKLTATLADGRTATGTVQGYSEQVLGAADIAGDGRHEVLMTVGGETWTIGAVIVLDGDRLVAITVDGDGSALGWGQHSNSNPRGTNDLACRVVDGKPSLLETSSTVTPGASVRQWKRSVWALDGARLVLRKRDSGTLAMTATPPPDLPLANSISCGTATLPNPASR